MNQIATTAMTAAKKLISNKTPIQAQMLFDIALDEGRYVEAVALRWAMLAKRDVLYGAMQNGASEAINSGKHRSGYDAAEENWY